MEQTVTWGPGDTWRKVGYLTYQNSLDYKYVLQQNPQWNMTATPPVGTVIKLDTNGSQAGTLNSVDPFWEQTAYNEDRIYFPFDTPQEYEAQVVKYTFYALSNNQELNGYTADSKVAVQGNPLITEQ